MPLGERLWDLSPNSRTAACDWVPWRCYLQPKGLWGAQSDRVTLLHLICPDHFSKCLPPRATPLVPTSAFWPLFCKDFNVTALQRVDGLSGGSEHPCVPRRARGQPGVLWPTSGIWRLWIQLKHGWIDRWTCAVLCQHVSILLFLTHKLNISFLSTTRASLSIWHIWQSHCTSKNFAGLLAAAGIFAKLYF